MDLCCHYFQKKCLSLRYELANPSWQFPSPLRDVGMVLTMAGGGQECIEPHGTYSRTTGVWLTVVQWNQANTNMERPKFRPQSLRFSTVVSQPLPTIAIDNTNDEMEKPIPLGLPSNLLHQTCCPLHLVCRSHRICLFRCVRRSQRGCTKGSALDALYLARPPSGVGVQTWPLRSPASYDRQHGQPHNGKTNPMPTWRVATTAWIIQTQFQYGKPHRDKDKAMMGRWESPHHWVTSDKDDNDDKRQGWERWRWVIGTRGIIWHAKRRQIGWTGRWGMYLSRWVQSHMRSWNGCSGNFLHTAGVCDTGVLFPMAATCVVRWLAVLLTLHFLERICEFDIVLESLVRSGYLVPMGTNRDRDQLVSAGKPKKTGPDWYQPVRGGYGLVTGPVLNWSWLEPVNNWF